MTPLDKVKNMFTGGPILYDRIVNVILQSSNDPNKVFPIITPVTGPKPDITVSFSMLEGEKTAYNIQVDIMNMVQDKSFNIYDYDLMEVEIGYRLNGTNENMMHTMTCAIFNSYAVSPNPNGVTTFIGIVGKHMRDIFVRKPIWVIMNKPSVTVGDLVGTVAHVIGHTASVPDAIKNYELFFRHSETDYSAGQVHYKAENGAALLSWLQGVITQAGTAHNQRWSVYAYNNCLYVIGDIEADGLELVKAVEITAMNAMTLTGNIVDVDAPYNPQVYPGALVVIRPNFFTSALPNMTTNNLISVFDRNSRRAEQIYRVLTMEVKFGTYTNNTMKFKAVGGSSVYTGSEDKIDISMSNSAAREQAENTLHKHQKKAIVTDMEAKTVRALSLGGNIDTPTAAIIESNSSVHIHFGTYIPRVVGDLNTFLALSGTFSSGGKTETVLNNTTTFASLASIHYEGKVAYKSVDQTDNNAAPPPLEPVTGESGGFDNPKIPCEYFAPIIALATYNQYLTKGREDSGFANVAECLTSTIPNGKSVIIPDVPDDITTQTTWAMAFKQYANVLLNDRNSGVSQADAENYLQIAYYMETL